MVALGDNKMTTATLDAQVNARWIALWLAVCAKILVPETTRNLKVPIKS